MEPRGNHCGPRAQRMYLGPYALSNNPFGLTHRARRMNCNAGQQKRPKYEIWASGSGTQAVGEGLLQLTCRRCLYPVLEPLIAAPQLDAVMRNPMLRSGSAR